MPCGNQNNNLAYVRSGRPGISLKSLGGTANSSSGTGMEGGSNRERMRFTLRQAWNGKAASGIVNGKNKSVKKRYSKWQR